MYNTNPNELLSATDYIVNQIVVSSLATGRTIDITHLMEELNLYDSIFSSSITGNIVLRDSIGLLYQLPVVGNESISIELVKSGTNNQVKFKKVFRVYKVTDRIPVTNTSEAYTIHFCSPYKIKSEEMKIHNGYNFKSNSYIVEQMLRKELAVDENITPILIENTFGNYNITVPGYSPLETCEWLAKKSVNSSYVPSFLFFESLASGFVFSSLSNLYNKRDLNVTYFADLKNVNMLDSSTRKMFSIYHSETDFEFDVLKNIKNGAYASTNYGIDLTTLSIEKTVFNSSRYSNQTMNKTFGIPRLRGVDSKTAFNMEKSVVRVSPLTRNQTKSSYVRSNDKTVFSNDTDLIVAQRNFIFSNLLDNKTFISVPGYNLLSAGNIITLKNVKRKYRETGEGQNIDEISSGKYMIVNSRHTFSPNGVYMSHLECATDSFDV